MTVSSHYTILADPLRSGLGVVVPQRKLKLLLRGVKSNRPIHRPPHITWALHRVLHYLTIEGTKMDVDRPLQRPFFLFVLVLGFRASQLAALTRIPLYISLTEDNRKLTIAPSHAFIAKNLQASGLPHRSPHHACAPGEWGTPSTLPS